MGVINLGLLIEKIKGKLESSGFIKNTDYASATKAGVVKIGNNVNVTSDGTISVTIPEAGGADEIYSGDGSGTLEFNFPTGKSLSSYKYLVLCCKTSGSTVASGIAATSLISTEGFTWCNCWYNASNFAAYKLTPTGMVADSSSGGMTIRKVYGVS